MNPAAAVQKQATAVGLRVQTAQAAVHNLAQTGVSVLKGNSGVTFIRIKEPSLAPSAVLRTYQSNGKTYAIDRNGVIFGGGNQVNTRGISAAAMDATSNGYTDAQTKKLTKPQRIEVPSIVTAEVVRFGQ
jgi:filamentous hemagglutinin family protein